MKIRKILSVLTPERRAPQPCEACQQPFTCGFGLAGCWCMQVQLSESTRRHLRKKYRACLCRVCLEKAEENEQQAEI